MKALHVLLTANLVAVALGALLWWNGRLPLATEPARVPRAAPRSAALCAPCPAAPPSTPAPALAAPAPSPAAGDAIEIRRYSVCPREEAPPALSRFPIDTEGRTLWALHCGSSVHLLAFEPSGERREPVRVARLSVPSYSPAEAPRALPVQAADIDGDARPDLLVGSLLLDRVGAPSGGALHWSRQRAEGGFEPALRLLELAPGAFVPAMLDAQAGADLALVQLHDAHTARPNELWLVHGGPAPLRFATREAGHGAQALAAADLDRDGRDDLALTSASENRVRIWLSSRGELARVDPSELELPNVREAISGDLDGDGARDLVLVGDRIWYVLAQKPFSPEVRSIAGSEGLRDVALEDVNGDGKLDLVGYAHPRLIAFEQTSALGFEQRLLFELSGDSGVLFARAVRFEGESQPDLVVVTESRGPDVQVELGLAHGVAGAQQLRFASRTQSLRDATLLQRFALP